MDNRKYKQSIYFDTDIIINYFKEGDIGKHARKVISQAKKMCKNPEVIVKVPLIVLGELTMISMKKEKIDLSKLLKRELDAEFTSPNKESYTIAFRLMNEDKLLEAADSLLVAQALTDKISEWLITTDTKLINNLIISKIKEELRSKLKISDRFGIG
ncbi:MAG: PIN domain-containing protein [Euryarchaeota archaeon]|nr:PIN domain-containing protein [Euryarchaeota archaeon]